MLVLGDGRDSLLTVPLQRLVRLREIPSRSIYENSSKNRAKLSLVFRHF